MGQNTENSATVLVERLQWFETFPKRTEIETLLNYYGLAGLSNLKTFRSDYIDVTQGK